MPVQQPVQYGRDAAHISWAAWVFRSLEDYMHERQHHLNESSSARLGGSHQLEILPSPNSKQTQSLGAWFSDGRMTWVPRFLISAVIFIRRGDFNARLLSSIYYVAQQFLQFRIALAPKIWTFAYILEKRLYFEKAPIFLESAYILRKRVYFEKAPIFYACTNILGKRQYFMILLYYFAWFCCCKYLCIFSVFFYAFCVRQYFWRNCFEA
jgi:hypothetical protein